MDISTKRSKGGDSFTRDKDEGSINSTKTRKALSKFSDGLYRSSSITYKARKISDYDFGNTIIGRHGITDSDIFQTLVKDGKSGAKERQKISLTTSYYEGQLAASHHIESKRSKLDIPKYVWVIFGLTIVFVLVSSIAVATLHFKGLLFVHENEAGKANETEEKTLQTDSAIVFSTKSVTTHVTGPGSIERTTSIADSTAEHSTNTFSAESSTETAQSDLNTITIPINPITLTKAVDYTTAKSTIPDITTKHSKLPGLTKTESPLPEYTTTQSTLSSQSFPEYTTKQSTVMSEYTMTESTLPEKTTTQPTIQDYTTTQPTIPEYTTTQPTIPEYTTTHPTVPEYTTTQPTDPEYTTTQPTIPEYTTTQPTDPEYTTTQPTVHEYPTTLSKLPEQSTTKPTVPEYPTTQSKLPEQSTTQPTVPEYPKTQSKLPVQSTTKPTVPEYPTTLSKLPKQSTTKPTVPEYPTTLSTLSTLPKQSTTQSPIPEYTKTLSTLQYIKTQATLPENTTTKFPLPENTPAVSTIPEYTNTSSPIYENNKTHSTTPENATTPSTVTENTTTQPSIQQYTTQSNILENTTTPSKSEQTTGQSTIPEQSASPSTKPDVLNVTYPLYCILPRSYYPIQGMCWVDNSTIAMLLDDNLIKVTLYRDGSCWPAVVDSGFRYWKMSCAHHGKIYVKLVFECQVLVYDKNWDRQVWNTTCHQKSVVANSHNIITADDQPSPLTIFNDKKEFLYELSLSLDSVYGLRGWDFMYLTESNMLIVTKIRELLLIINMTSGESVSNHVTKSNYIECPGSIAVDPTDQVVYVLDYCLKKIAVFHMDGNFQYYFDVRIKTISGFNMRWISILHEMKDNGNMLLAVLYQSYIVEGYTNYMIIQEI